jgi:hypothetical protein
VSKYDEKKKKIQQKMIESEYPWFRLGGCEMNGQGTSDRSTKIKQLIVQVQSHIQFSPVREQHGIDRLSYHMDVPCNDQVRAKGNARRRECRIPCCIRMNQKLEEKEKEEKEHHNNITTWNMSRLRII